MADQQLAQWAFNRPGVGQRYATKQFPIEEKDRIRALLPNDAQDISLVVCGAITPKREYELNPGAFPSGLQEIEDAKAEGIWQYVNGESPEFVRLIVLTQGKRATMRLAELRPLEIEAKRWAQSANELEIGNCRQQAFEILRAKFANVKSPDDLIRQTSGSLFAEPADYDDSDIAIGRQRLAQLERFNAAEKARKASESDLSDV